MTAEDARLLASAIKKLNSFKDRLQAQPSVVVGTIWTKIIEAILNGETSCVSYIMPIGVNLALSTNKFKVEEEKEEDLVYYTISWEEENGSKSRSKKRKDSIKCG